MQTFQNFWPSNVSSLLHRQITRSRKGVRRNIKESHRQKAQFCRQSEQVLHACRQNGRIPSDEPISFLSVVLWSSSAGATLPNSSGLQWHRSFAAPSSVALAEYNSAAMEGCNCAKLALWDPAAEELRYGSINATALPRPRHSQRLHCFLGMW